MKANELRVGNIVFEPLNENKRAFKVFEIYHEKDYDKINYHNALSFEPVQLNEEWLKNLGFKFVDSHYGFLSPKDENENSIRLRIEHGKYLFSLNNFWSVRIEYVHQLQNLYFILCGVELQLTAP